MNFQLDGNVLKKILSCWYKKSYFTNKRNKNSFLVQNK